MTAAPSQQDLSRPRHRASVACMACRERRTRCVIQNGQSSCTQCLETGQECIIKNDDQRRKPVSKAYVNQLQDRIQQLEASLREKEAQTTKGTHQHSNSPADAPAPTAIPQQTSPEPAGFAVSTPPTPDPLLPEIQNPSARNAQSPGSVILSPARSGSAGSSMVHRLLSTQGHVSVDQLAGRQRYFGPTTNCHIYLDLASDSDEGRRQVREQARRTQRVLSAVPQASQDYLMRLFWKHYNAMIRVVDQEAFDEGRNAGGGPFYSGFLHVCILAAGYRFADKLRPDMVRITLPGRESLLHREAKYMLDYEIERPGGLPSIAALLILGDLEVGCGRDNVGWLYSGMAYRLCFDVGLHLDRTGCGLSQRDIEIGRMTLWACVIFDRYWALFLGRPTALKPDDLEIYELSHKFDRLGMSQPGPETSVEIQIYQALFELMELAGKIPAIMPNTASHGADLDRLVYLRMAPLDSELEKWYARLPQPLKYTAENARTAPQSFFMLHQQYYSAMIMLHRPFAAYDEILDGRSEHTPDGRTIKHLSALSRSTCTTCAGRIAQIFWQQLQRFDTRRIFVTGLQHAGNAATALVAAIAASTDRVANDRSMRYLECLVAVLDDLSEAYQPAEQMATIFKAVVKELRELNPALQLSHSVPARRSSSADADSESEQAPCKRGASIRAQATTQSMQSMQSMSWPSETQFAKPAAAAMPSILPSPALTYQSMAEKPAARRVTDQDGLIGGHGVANMDDSWSIFSGPDRFAIGSVMAGHGSPSAFCSPWPSTETPSFFRMASDAAVDPGMNGDFMHLVDEPEGTAQGPAGTGDSSIPLQSADDSVYGASGLSQRPTNSTDRVLSPSNARIRGHRAAKRKPPSARADSIWTEIIS